MSTPVQDPHAEKKEGARLASQTFAGEERIHMASKIARTTRGGTRLFGKIAGEGIAETTGKALLKKVPIVCSAIMTGEGLWDLGKAAYAAVKGSQDAKIYAMQGVLRLAGGGAGLAADIAAIGTAGVATPVAVGVTTLGFGTEATAAELEKMRLNGEKPTWKDLAKGHVTEQAGVDAWHFAERIGHGIEEKAGGLFQKFQHAL